MKKKIKQAQEANEKKNVCCLCGKEYGGYGNNAWPLSDGRCCDECNQNVVLARLAKSRYPVDVFGHKRWMEVYLQLAK